MALPLPVYMVVSALSLEDRHGQTLIHSDYSILLDLVNQYHSTPIIYMPLQLSIRHNRVMDGTQLNLQLVHRYSRTQNHSNAWNPKVHALATHLINLRCCHLSH
jgi:hypothetical protein